MTDSADVDGEELPEEWRETPRDPPGPRADHARDPEVIVERASPGWLIREVSRKGAYVYGRAEDFDEARR